MINEQIRDREVRLIGPDGEQIGVVSSREAQKIADEAGLDLVKIAPNAKPPVCKVIDTVSIVMILHVRKRMQRRSRRQWN